MKVADQTGVGLDSIFPKPNCRFSGVRILRVAATDARELGAPITGLSHVQLFVSDVVVSAQWYRAVLGLVPYVEDLEVGYIAVKHRDAKLVVVLTNGLAHGVDGGASQHLDHLAFVVREA